MKFKSVKKASEVTLEGITVELDTVDGSIKGVILTDAKGNTLRVIERNYNLFVEVPAPPEMEKKYRLSGNLLGLPVNMNFDSKYEADAEQGDADTDHSESAGRRQMGPEISGRRGGRQQIQNDTERGRQETGSQSPQGSGDQDGRHHEDQIGLSGPEWGNDQVKREAADREHDGGDVPEQTFVDRRDKAGKSRKTGPRVAKRHSRCSRF